MTQQPAEHDVVRLVADVPDKGLRAGSKGTVVLSYPGSDPVVVEVEFVDDEGETTALATVEAALLEVVWTAPADG